MPTTMTIRQKYQRKRAKTRISAILKKGKSRIFESTSKSALKIFRTVQYTPMLDQNVSFTDHGTSATYYYNQDERQSVRNLTASDGTATNAHDYTAYGDKVDYGTSGDVEQRYTYTGRELNDISGNYFLTTGFF